MRLRSKKQPRNIARIISYILEVSTKAFTTSCTRNTFPPSSVILLGRPVYLRHHDRSKSSHWSYLRIPSTLKSFVSSPCRRANFFTAILLRITTVPTRITVNCKTYIFTFDTMSGISRIGRLIRKSGNPNNVIAMASYFINNSLK